MHACVLGHFSHVPLSVTLWTVAHQALLSMGILQARILEWVAMPSSRGSSQPRNQIQVTYVYCTGRRVLCYYQWESPSHHSPSHPNLHHLLISEVST